MQKQIENLFPQVLSYQSANQFLKDYFTARKKSERNFSYEVWAAELGFNTRTYIKLIVEGQRNITNEFVESLSRKLKFSEREKLHFSILAQIGANKLEKMNEALKNMFFETFSVDSQRRIMDEKDFISSLVVPLVQLLVASEDFVATPKSMQKILNIDENIIQQTLELLENLNIIENQGEKGWVSKVNTFNVKKDHEALKEFHGNTLNEAADKLQTEDIFKKFRSIYFSIESERLAELSEDMENFLRKIRNKYSTDQLMQGKELVKINLQSYSLSGHVKKV